MDEPDREQPRPPRPLLAACVIVFAESAALVVAAAIVVVKALTETADDVVSALLLAVIALAGAAMLFFAGRGLLHMRPAARSPVLVVQVLALPVAYTLAFQADRTGYGAPILIAALAVLYLMFTPPVRAVLDREDSR